NEDIDMVMGNPFQENDELFKLAQSRMKNFAKHVNFSDDVKLEVQWGHPKTTILAWAADNDTDLIIMGAHGHHGIERLLGSVSNSVAHQAPCDTLLVRE
ncbi:MAG TPA: universal stress protein, partial [Gammaproteobacteria bacterium]|nr:universal stress protein [Gammaproteobacteria bacterium]